MADRKPPAEPTMEEILSSIRRIIAEDEDKDEPEAPARGPANLTGDEVLDLTEIVPEAEPPRPRAVESKPAAAQAASPPAAAANPLAPPTPATPAAGAA